MDDIYDRTAKGIINDFICIIPYNGQDDLPETAKECALYLARKIAYAVNDSSENHFWRKVGSRIKKMTPEDLQKLWRDYA